MRLPFRLVFVLLLVFFWSACEGSNEGALVAAPRCTSSEDPASSGRVCAETITLAMAQAIDPLPVFQPTQAQEAAISRVVTPNETALSGAPMILQDNVPYYHYRYLENANDYIFHPMAMGLYWSKHRTDRDALAIQEKCVELAVELPNGGLAWYYPRHIPISRLNGPDLLYSAISQAQILSGHLSLSKAQSRDPHLSKRIFRALQLPYEEGGVALGDFALLELPLYRSAPEIVLNGWLHALIHLRDYAQISGDEDATTLLMSNLQFLSETLEDFDVPDLQLSRYSDLCPYKVNVAFDAQTMPNFKILYIPRRSRMPTIVIPLRQLDNPDRPSIYDNQILQAAADSAKITVSISAKYDTVLVSDSEQFTVRFKSGVYDPHGTTPRQSGPEHLLRSCAMSSGSFVWLNSVNGGLIPGYPTNFSAKGQRNFYHVYHVVALLYIAKTAATPTETRRTLVRWALRWRDYMTQRPPPDGADYAVPQTILDQLNSGKYDVSETQWEQLVQWGESVIAPSAE